MNRLQERKNDFLVVAPATYEGATVFASVILIVISCAIFASIRIFGTRLKFAVKGMWPNIERKLSYSKAAFSRNSVSLIVFVAIVLVPALFVALPAFQAVFTGTLSAAFSGSGVWSDYWQSLLLSYGFGAIVTVLVF